jgi:hypothetical protein
MWGAPGNGEAGGADRPRQWYLVFEVLTSATIGVGELPSRLAEARIAVHTSSQSVHR